MKKDYKIEGMHCESCIEKIKATLSPYVYITEISLHPPHLQIEKDTLPSIETLNHYIKSAGNYFLKPENKKHEIVHKEKNNYFPLFLIIFYLILVVTINNFKQDHLDWLHWMNQFMAGFFLVFSAFKLFNLKGFVEGYKTYDLLAHQWPFYGFIYPFLEFTLGILYLGNWLPTITAISTIIIMGFSSLGVINSLRKKQKIRCACLGTVLNVPLSTITLIEDLTMVLLAFLCLFIFTTP